MNRLIDQYDSLIADADGVIYRGPIAVPHALESLRVAIDQMPWCVVTNNAAMPPSAVADRISGLGLAMEPSDVVTSPQGAVAYLLNRGIPAGAPILIVGGPGIDEAVAAAGFTPMREHSIPPVAVVQGFGPDVGWRELSEAGYAIAAGALWVATNLDLNIPTERGLAPGNGALVGAVEHAVGRAPDAVTGKPEPLLFELAAQRMGSSRPLVLGDRLDTDIRGANRAGMDSLLVLTGVSGASELVNLAAAERQWRPTFLAEDLRALLEPAVDSRIDVDARGHGPLPTMRRLLARAWGDPGEASEVLVDLQRASTAWAGERSAASLRS